MADLEFTIRTKADLAAAKAVETQLERDIAKMKLLGAETEKIAKAEANLARVRTSLANTPAGLGGGNSPASHGIVFIW